MPRSAKWPRHIIIRHLPNALLMRHKLRGLPGPPIAWYDKTIPPRWRYFSYTPPGCPQILLDRTGTCGEFPVEVDDSDVEEEWTPHLLPPGGFSKRSTVASASAFPTHGVSATPVSVAKLPPLVVTPGSTPRRCPNSPASGTPSLQPPRALLFRADATGGPPVRGSGGGWGGSPPPMVANVHPGSAADRLVQELIDLT